MRIVNINICDIVRNSIEDSNLMNDYFIAKQTNFQEKYLFVICLKFYDLYST